MADRARSGVGERTAPNRRTPSVTPTARGPCDYGRIAGLSPAGALELQRTLGNRAATRILDRWAAHPDKDKKGQFMTDSAVGEYNKFNPPLSK